MTSEAKDTAESNRFYIGETVHGSSYIIDRASQRSAIGRSGSFVVAIDSGEASWVCAALNEKQDRDNATDAEPTGEPCEPIVAGCDGCGQQIQNWEGSWPTRRGRFATGPALTCTTPLPRHRERLSRCRDITDMAAGSGGPRYE